MGAWDGTIDTGVRWDAPLMLNDGTPAIYNSESQGGDRWAKVWLSKEQKWELEQFTSDGSHIRRIFGASRAHMVNRPRVDIHGPLYWLDTGVRCFLRDTWLSDPSIPEGHYVVDCEEGGRHLVDRDGIHIGEPPRILANFVSEQMMAQGRLKIKRAQEQRRRRLEQERADALANLNPELFGSF